MTDRVSARVTAQVRDIRETQGVTREELAAAARSAGAPDTFTARALRSLESDRRAPSVDELLWLAEALNMPVRELLAEHAALFGADEKRAPECGPVEEATRLAIEGLGALAGRDAALAEAAYALAKKLDGDAGMAAAAVSKELRAVLDAIWQGHDDEDEDEDDLGPG